MGGRLALWARRLMGEALSQSQRVVADRDALSTMLVGGVADGFDLAEVGRMFSRITEAHTKRMAALGLAASAAVSGGGSLRGARRSTAASGRRSRANFGSSDRGARPVSGTEARGRSVGPRRAAGQSDGGARPVRRTEALDRSGAPRRAARQAVADRPRSLPAGRSRSDSEAEETAAEPSRTTSRLPAPSALCVTNAPEEGPGDTRRQDQDAARQTVRHAVDGGPGEGQAEHRGQERFQEHVGVPPTRPACPNGCSRHTPDLRNPIIPCGAVVRPLCTRTQPPRAETAGPGGV
ncbi:hypothetical protein SBADM41S_06809 [Streptomyces badius]